MAMQAQLNEVFKAAVDGGVTFFDTAEVQLFTGSAPGQDAVKMHAYHCSACGACSLCYALACASRRLLMIDD